jgi:hypothetical protein
MSDAFVPFAPKTAPRDSAEPFRVKVLSSANGAAVPFQAAGGAAATGHAAHGGQPKVSLVRDGDRITAVRVQCACGEVVELECVY